MSPIPTKNKGEEKNEFISRCMSSDVMKKEFPKKDQRLAICYSKLRVHNKVIKKLNK